MLHINYIGQQLIKAVSNTIFGLGGPKNLFFSHFCNSFLSV